MANQLTSLPSVEAFAPGDDPATTAVRRRKWIERFNHLIVARNIQCNERKRLLMLFLAGEADVFRRPNVPVVPDDADQNVDNVFLAAKRARWTRSETRISKNTSFDNSNRTPANRSTRT